MADMQQVMEALNTRHRVVLVPKRTGKESEMKKSKKTVEKKASAKQVKRGKTPKATVAKPELVKTAAQLPAGDKTKRMSGLDAAAFVLSKAGAPMSCKEIVSAMMTSELWSTKGKTPEATIYSAIIREIATKGTAARFKKVDRGQFAFAGKEA